MADPKIRIRRSATPNKVPETSQLQLGELAINTFDGKLYLEQDQTSASGIVTVIAVNPWSVGVGSIAYDTYFTAGNVGVGTTNPTQLLDVAGDIRLRGAIYDSLNSTGSSNQVLVSNAGAGVTWKTLSSIPVGDANTLDGLDSTQFLRSDVADTKTGVTTFADDATFQSNVYLGNDDNLYFGASNELRIYHNSSFNNSIIYHQDTLGTLSFRSNSGVINFYDYKNAKWQAKFDEDVIELNYSGSKVFETIGYGISITGVGYYTGIVTASSFVKEGGTSSQFLKADGTVDSNTYLTAESQTLDGVLGLGNTSSFGMSVGVVTATGFVGNLTGTASTATRIAVSESGSQTDHFIMLARESTPDSAVRLDAGLKFHTGTNSLTITGDTIIGAGVSIVGVATASAFVGDGSGLTNVFASVGISTNTTNQAQIIPFAVSYGSTIGFGATDGLVFNPSSTRLGIGSDAPAYSLDVVGDINSSTDVKINGTGVLDTALALAIALG